MKTPWQGMAIRAGYFTIALVAASLLLPVAGSIVRQAWEPWIEARRRIESARPPRELHIRTEDFRRFPRAGFGFRFVDNDGDCVDTFRGFLTKHAIPYPDTTVRLVLSRVEMDTIYQKVIEIRLFEYRQPHPRGWAGDPVNNRLIVRAGAVAESLSWFAFGEDFRQPVERQRREHGLLVTEITFRPGTDEWKRLYGLRALMRRIVETRPEYEALPGRQNHSLPGSYPQAHQ